MRTPRFGGHSEQNDWQTGVKILPCPKLRLRAVKYHIFRILESWVQITRIVNARSYFLPFLLNTDVQVVGSTSDKNTHDNMTHLEFMFGIITTNASC